METADNKEYIIYLVVDKNYKLKKNEFYLNYSDIQMIEEWSQKYADEKKEVKVHSGPKAAFCSVIIRETGKWKNVTYTN
jgi:hypothetical protein